MAVIVVGMSHDVHDMSLGRFEKKQYSSSEKKAERAPKKVLFLVCSEGAFLENTLMACRIIADRRIFLVILKRHLIMLVPRNGFATDQKL